MVRVFEILRGHHVLTLYYCIGIASILILWLAQKNCLLIHGKSLSSNEQPMFLVQKKFFLHFYIIGVFINALIWMNNPTSLHLYFVITIYRRLMETFFVMRYSDVSKMHILHYFAGLTFYPCTGLLINNNDSPASGIIFFVSFILISWMQLDAHYRLSNLRRSGSHYQPIPLDGPFKYVICPHYSLEILLYFLILSRIPSLQSALCFIFVTLNLSISAFFTKTWYLRLHNDKRWSILPFII